jgi:hypothetical protein
MVINSHKFSVSSEFTWLVKSIASHQPSTPSLHAILFFNLTKQL